MYAMISKPFVRRTFATFRRAEFGFFGVVVYTRVHTPRRNGFDLRAGDFSFLRTSPRLRRTSWLMVGMNDGWGRQMPADAAHNLERTQSAPTWGGTDRLR